MQRMLCSALCFVLVLMLLPMAAEAKRSRLPSLEWGLEASVATIHNTNLIGVSASDRNRFLSNPVEFPTPLESVDDLENELLIHPDLNWRAPLNLMLGADYRFKYVHRLRNSFTDYQTHSLSLSARPRVAGYNWSARLRFLVIPSYYVRVYRDRDYGEWHSARYANYDYLLSGRYRWWHSLWSEAGAGYGTYYYNRKFTEYDSEYGYASFGSGYDFGVNWSLSGAYSRRISENVGKDQSGVFTSPPSDPEQIGDTEYGDSDFNEDDWSAQLVSRLNRLTSFPVEASLSYRFRRRVYTTDRTLDQDTFHRGRLDRRNQITFALAISAIPRLSVEPFFTYDERHTDSNAPAVAQVKNFIRREYGMTLLCRIK